MFLTLIYRPPRGFVSYEPTINSISFKFPSTKNATSGIPDFIPNPGWMFWAHPPPASHWRIRYFCKSRSFKAFAILFDPLNRPETGPIRLFVTPNRLNPLVPLRGAYIAPPYCALFGGYLLLIFRVHIPNIPYHIHHYHP